jgi:hypothetical protein
MSEILRGWNAEKVMVVAPDHKAAKTSKKLAVPGKWQNLGHNDYCAWGEYQGSGTTPYQLKADLLRLEQGEAGIACTCPSRKQPCKHAVGLLFLIVDHAESFVASDAPDYVTEWLDKAALRAQKSAEKQKQVEQKAAVPQQREKTLNERKAKIADGLQELGLWLTHLIRHGLGDPQVKSYAFWDAKAARMVDAQCPGVATWLRDLAGLPARRTDWIETLLDQLSRIYLLTQSFKRFDDLPEAIQADLRTVLGWPLRREDLVDSDVVGLQDYWLVTGHHQEELESRLRTQRLWLRGRDSGRDALILEFAYGAAPFATYLRPGQAINAELIFFPGRYPLRAFVRADALVPEPGQPLPGISIQAGIEAYSRALACNPWLLQYPFLLDSVIPQRHAGQWVLREANGAYLPIAGGFPHPWSLLALGGGGPLQVAGEWNGCDLLPTGAMTKGRFVDFSIVGKL